jgi:replication factor C large subunit
VPLLTNASVFGKRILLFLDEVDGISGRDDYGGLSFLVSTLKNSNIPIIMAANAKNSKIKEIIKNSKTIEFQPLSPFSLFLLLQRTLQKENRDLELSKKLKLVDESMGDARTLLNLAQSQTEGDYHSIRKPSNVYPIEDCINLFFSSGDISQIKDVLMRSEIIYLSPRFGASPEERAKDIVHGLFSTVVANQKSFSKNDIAIILDRISQIDIYVNKIHRNRQWHLLRYANNVLISKLYDVTRNFSIRYSQYSIPFPLIGSIFIRGQSTRFVIKALSQIFHTGSSEFGLFYFSHLLQVIKDKGYENIVFDTEVDDKLNELLTKELDRSKKRA